MSTVQQHQHSEGAVSGRATPSAGLTDAEWEARLEALRQLADTNAASAREQAQAALEELLGQQRLALEARFSWLVGHCYVLLAKKVEAAVALHRAVGIAQAIGRIDLEAHHLTTLGVAQAMMSAYSEAIECYERALGLHKGLPPSADNDLILAKVQCNFGATYSFMGLPEKALPLYQQASDLFLRLGRARDGTACLGNCALVHMERAERLSRQPSADERVQAVAAASEARALAERVVADPSMGPEDGASIIARLTLVRAHIVLGDCAAAIEELNQIDHHLTSDARRSRFRAERSTLRARLLRLTGRTSEAIAELQAEPLDDLTPFDRTGILEELVAAQEAAGDLSGALASFRRYHELTLQARDQSAEQRGQVLHARLELERAQHKAEIERLRAEQLILRNEELARQAHMDALTGLPNRRGLDAALAHRVGDERARFACVLADIDHFKRINDRYSHLVGDEVLRRVGALMREVVRDGDVAARYGGEEFALLLDRVDGRQAVEVCERLRQVIAAQPWEQIVGGLAVTISLGVVMRRAGDSGEALLGRADGCLYAAKAAGRDRVVAEAAEKSARDSAPESPPTAAR
jgi:diguanylate cyclase (GGDEF)-like protein